MAGGLGTQGFGGFDSVDDMLFISDDATVGGTPHNCLEGYTFDFAFNYMNMDYMQSVNKLEQDQKEAVLNNLQISKWYHFMHGSGTKYVLDHLISLPLWSSWFHPFIILYTLPNLSVFRLCLRNN